MFDPNRPEIIPEYIVIGDDSFEDLGLSPDEMDLLKSTYADEIIDELYAGDFEDDDPESDPGDDFFDDF